MTEPDVASSDATNIAMRCERDGDDYVLNGEKWWSSGAGDPRCKIYIVMVARPMRTRPKHQQHSMILVPADTPGITKLRAMKVYGDDDAPHGHLHLKFENVRVPASNLMLGEGQGLRDRAGPARAGPHPSLHARHRPGRDGAGADVQALAAPRGLRQEAGATRRQFRHHRRMPHGDRDGAAALPQGGLDDGPGRRDAPPRRGSARSRSWRRASR